MKRLFRSTILTVYWFGTIVWTVLVLIVLLKPSSRSSTHDYSIDTFLYTFLRFDFEVYDYIEAAGHVLLFIVLTALWNLTLSRQVTQSQAFRLTISFALVIAFGTEIGQFFVYRGSMLFDLLANILGVSLTSFWIKSSIKNSHKNN